MYMQVVDESKTEELRLLKALFVSEPDRSGNDVITIVAYGADGAQVGEALETYLRETLNESGISLLLSDQQNNPLQLASTALNSRYLSCFHTPRLGTLVLQYEY